MAKLLPGAVQFTGRLGKFTAYKMKGSDQIILRGHGGGTKKQINNDPNFANTRRLNSEFGGRARGTQWINRAIQPVRSLADYNFTGILNALIKHIQLMDTVSVWGERGIPFTKSPSLFDGFSLNKENTFESFVRTSTEFSFSKEDFSAQVKIPALQPHLNFFTQYDHPVYSIIVALGAIPDLTHSQYGYIPKPSSGPSPADIKTEWYPIGIGSPALTLDLKMQNTDFFESVPHILMLSIGICFGTLGRNGEIERVKYAGAAKILAAK